MNPAALLPRFGLHEFRPGQLEVIEAVLARRDCLSIMPTGGGKSLCYQLPALALGGLTVVVSPLIALMKDQVDSLDRLEIPATFINSSLAFEERERRTDAMVGGAYALVYVAPERLRSAPFVEAIRRANLQLLAIDEAHCISQWGHDFRPDYSRLGKIRSKLGEPPTIALTATATKLVRADIAQVLSLRDPLTFVSGFRRENLRLRVETPGSNVAKDQRLIEYLGEHSGSGIVYAATRKSCEHLVQLIGESTGRTAAFYHAGIEAEERKRIQESFMAGRAEVIVATNAFGMGIDKSDVRFVVHYNLPGSLEAYYQEAGRAGRDGQPADCLLLFSYQDRYIQEFFIENSYPARETVRDVYEFLRAAPQDPIELTLQQIREALDLQIGTEGVRVCETLLEKAGAIERMESVQNQASLRIDSTLPTLVDLLPREARVRRKVLRGLEQIVGTARGERVFFSPHRLSSTLDLPWESIARAIRELSKLEGFDYVPPFRGRAVHLLKRDTPFEKLGVDFEELDRRKRNEFEKLDQMIRFVQSKRCRQLEILEYFGDPQRQRCQVCDNCGGEETPASPVGKSQLAGLDASTAARVWYAILVALSGAARTHGRIGKQLLAQMLTGSESKKLKPLRLDRLPTFGRLRALTQVDVEQLLTALLQAGYLMQTETTRFRPVVVLCDSGRELLSSPPREDVLRQLPAELIKSICNRLRDVDLATLSGGTNTPQPESASSSPPDVTASKQPPASGVPPEPRSVESFETRAPATPDMVPANVPVESSRQDAPSLESVPPPHRESPPRPDVPRVTSDGYWTWRLFDQGFTLAEVCEIRRLTPGEICQELINAAERGQRTELSWMLSTEQITTLERLSRQTSGDALIQAARRLPRTVSHWDMLYYLRCTAPCGRGRR